jgi:hypothetical protein
MTEEEFMLIYKSRILKMAKGSNLTVTKEFIDALNLKLGGIVIDSVRRCVLEGKEVVDADHLKD